MITINETNDAEKVWQIAMSPSVFNGITNDEWFDVSAAVKKSHVKNIVENKSNHVLLVEKNGEDCGCFVMDNRGEGTYEIHTMLTFKCRGKDAIHAGKMATKYAFEHFADAQKLTSFCPASLPETYLFARFVGFHKAGTAAVEWIKNGVKYAITIVQMTRKDFELCH